MAVKKKPKAVRFKEGDQIVTCGQTPGFHRYGTFFAPKVYQAKVRKKDKALVWKLRFTVEDHEVAVDGWRPSANLLRRARAYARDRSLPFALDIKDNMEVAQTKPAKKAPTVRKRKVPETGEVVEETILVGRFRKIDDDNIV